MLWVEVGAQELGAASGPTRPSAHQRVGFCKGCRAHRFGRARCLVQTDGRQRSATIAMHLVCTCYAIGLHCTVRVTCNAYIPNGLVCPSLAPCLTRGRSPLARRLASVNSILTVPERFFQHLSHCHRLPGHLAGDLRNGNQFSATNDALAQQDCAHDAVVYTHIRHLQACATGSVLRLCTFSAESFKAI